MSGNGTGDAISIDDIAREAFAPHASAEALEQLRAIADAQQRIALARARLKILPPAASMPRELPDAFLSGDVAAAVAAEVDDESGPGASVSLLRASDVTVRRLRWLWSARLVFGGITLVEGAPEKGKSTLLCDLAARVTTGAAFPGEPDDRDPAAVVMLVAEDDLGTTVVPRLTAAGADLSRVYFLGATRDADGQLVPFHLSDDVERLRSRCRDVGAAFVVVDPLVSFIGSRKGREVDTANDRSVRKSLAPLRELAEDLDASIAAVRHFRKGAGTNAIEAGGGSIAFSGLARVVLAALPDPADPDRFLFAVSKNNLVSRDRRPAWSYTIVPAEHDPDVGRIAWGAPVELSAGDILMAAAEQTRGDDAGETGAGANARAFLSEFLASGDWIPAADVYAASERREVNEKTLKRAKARLGIEVSKRGLRWYWRLRGGQSVPVVPVSPLGSLSPLSLYKEGQERQEGHPDKGDQQSLLNLPTSTEPEAE